tara:strand:- start:36545 stop:38044 length:1500 start_codon:yes stop_codon:yes gene_type:complete
MKNLLLVLSALYVGNINAQFWKTSDVEKLSGAVNTEAEESIPVFSKDEGILYFVRTFDKENEGGYNDQDVWYSEKDANGDYAACKPLKSINNKLNNSVVGLNSTGTTMYLINAYDGKKDFEKGLAVSTGEGDAWKIPTKIDIPGLDIEGDYYGFHMDENEDVMIISYSGPNSLGEEDLYYSQKENGSWSVPIHMGASINSTGFEISPFLSITHDTLFFSSNGFGGEGDADIFYSVKQGSMSQWSAPINVGSTINSPKFDAYFSHNGTQAYWSSNRDGEFSDIYRLEILYPPLGISATGKDVTVYQGSDGSIDAIIDGGVAPYSYTWSNGSTDEDPTNLVKGEYKVTVTDARGQVASTIVFIDEPALEIAPVDVVSYENFEFKYNFKYNRNKLSTRKGKLKKFVKEIENQFKDGRGSVTINIHSSASHVPTKTYRTNKILATKRAENMKYDLISFFEKKGFADRINVVVVTSEVAGPNYDGDARSQDKYYPFQFVELKTE